MNKISRYNNIKSILPCLVEWINVLSTLYLIATLITSFNYQRLAIYIYFISTFTDIIINKRYLNIKWEKAKSTFVMMIIFYICMWIWHIFKPCEYNELFHSTDTRLPFIAFGILGLCSTINPKIKINYVAYTMLITSVAAIIYVIFKQHNILFAPDITIHSLRDILPQIRQGVLHVTHIEFNLYLNCTMIMCFICFLNSNNKLNKTILSIAILFIYIILLTSEGRIGFITANILFLLFVASTIYHYNPKLLIPSIIIFTLIVTPIISKHDRLNIRYITEDPRVAIWELSYEIIKEKPILGHGVCHGRQLFIEQSTNNPDLNHFWNIWHSQYPNYNKNRFHCHNAFLESAIEFGLIGLIISLSIFVLPILLTSNKKRLYLSFFILTFAIQAMLEAFTFHLQILLFCWILYFFINTNFAKDN